MKSVRPHFGTLVEVRVDDARDPNQATEAAFAAIARVERLMSCHDPASELSRLNREAHLNPVQVDPWTYEVLRLSLEFFRASDGLFDCAIGARQVATERLPARSRDACDAHASSADIELVEPRHVRYRKRLYVDLGGIAKGFAVDRAIEALRGAGACSGVVNAGGDLRAFGPQTEPVHVRLPANAGLVHVGALREAAMATSITDTDPPLGLPLLDPRGALKPAAQLVSVFAGDCVVADALTKVVALEREGVARILERYGARALCWHAPAMRWEALAGTAS